MNYKKRAEINSTLFYSKQPLRRVKNLDKVRKISDFFKINVHQILSQKSISEQKFIVYMFEFLITKVTKNQKGHNGYKSCFVFSVSLCELCDQKMLNLLVINLSNNVNHFK